MIKSGVGQEPYPQVPRCCCCCNMLCTPWLLLLKKQPQQQLLMSLYQVLLVLLLRYIFCIRKGINFGAPPKLASWGWCPSCLPLVMPLIIILQTYDLGWKYYSNNSAQQRQPPPYRNSTWELRCCHELAYHLCYPFLAPRPKNNALRVYIQDS